MDLESCKRYVNTSLDVAEVVFVKNDENTYALYMFFECVIEPASSMHLGRHKSYVKTSLGVAKVLL